MHARAPGWQSTGFIAAVLVTLVASVVVARADAEPPPPPDAPIQQVPQVPQTGGTPEGRAVEDGLRPDGRPDAGDRDRRGRVRVVYTIERDGNAHVRVVTAGSRAKARQLVDELSTRPRVAAVEIDTVYAAFDDGPERDRQWGLELIGADALWPGAHACGRTIAVVDSGVNGNHPDLQGTVLPGKSMVGRGIALRDSSGHGTQVAGVAAAAQGNGKGITGLAPGVRILPIAVEDAAGRMHASDVARAIRYAILREADVINLSLGGPTKSPNVEYWLQRANEAGIPVVASAGNAHAAGNPTIWPAASPYTIAVAAAAPTGVWAAFSSTGEYVDVAAPGVAVLTTAGDGGYVAANGTSVAAPFVSATLALLRTRAPDLEPEDLRQILIDTARDAGANGWDPQFGHGIVDPAAALEAVGGTARKCFIDIGELTLAGDIERLAFAGVTDGCAPRRFCPAQPVTRGQMATFVARTLNQTPTDADFFADDEGNPHEQGINRVAQAGITRGCGPQRFCPGERITRAQMAAFIARALNLPPGAEDAFDDDDRDVHEDAINALAAAGITSGCDADEPGRFCPEDTVTRAQMAAFLVRMIDLGDA